VKDAQGNLVLGRTRWRRFAAVMVPAVVAAGAIGVGVAKGAIAASISVSGSTFKVSASRLEGTGFVQYGGFATEKGGNPANPFDPKNHATAVSGIASAKLFDLCQSVKVANLPLSLVIHAGGGGTPAEATDLLINMTQLTGNATFTNIVIGQDASTLDKAGPNAHGLAGQFGQQADSVVITNLKQVAWSTTAGSFTLNGLDLHVDADGSPEECF
jgi:Family of unknown function (DUF6230)